MDSTTKSPESFPSTMQAEVDMIVATNEYELKTEGTLHTLNQSILQSVTPLSDIHYELDIDKPGHLNNLSEDQKSKLFDFWALLLEFLSSPFPKDFEPAASDKKNLALAEALKENMSISSTTSLSDTSSILSEEKSEAMKKHPLSNEFWIQLATDNPDSLILRFLRARKWDVAEAFSMFLESIKWRRRFGIQRILQNGESCLKRQIFESGKGYFWGTDRNKRLVIYLTARLHNRNEQTLQETTEYTVYQIETGRRLFFPGSETVTIVFDLENAPLSSFDLGSMQFMIQCFQNFYPESLGKVLVLNAPWIFWGFWKMIKPLLDPVVVGKIIFIDDYKEIQRHVHPDNLLEIYGGACKYKFKYILPACCSPSLASSSVSQDQKEPNFNLGSSAKSNNSSTSSLEFKPNGPVPLSDSELDDILKRVEHLKDEFINATLHLCSLHRDRNLNIGEGLYFIWKSKREVIQLELQQLYRRLELYSVPDNFHHRLGVISRSSDNSRDEVSWKHF